jgi:hypothetical protein
VGVQRFRALSRAKKPAGPSIFRYRSAEGTALATVPFVLQRQMTLVILFMLLRRKKHYARERALDHLPDVSGSSLLPWSRHTSGTLTRLRHRW